METEHSFFLIKEYLEEGRKIVGKYSSGLQLFSQAIRKQERNSEEHQSECLAPRSSERINSSMTMKTTFLLIEVISSPTQQPHSSSDCYPNIEPEAKCSADGLHSWLVSENTEANYQSLLQALLVFRLHSKICRIFMLSSLRLWEVWLSLRNRLQY